MKPLKTFLSALILGVLIVPATALAQKENKDKDKEKDKEKDVQEIVITRKGDKKDKVVVEINGDKVTVNGKPAGEYEGDITVNTHKYKGWGREIKTPGRAYTITGDGNGFYTEDENRAMLGVVTETEDEGAKINEITKESAAEKAGLKEGDIITKIDDTKIENPDDLTKAIRNHKPGDKVSITYLRDKKQQKTTAELSKWKGMKLNSFNWNNGQNFNFSMPLELTAPRAEAFPRIYGDNLWDAYNGRPKLGLSVQDSEDGKGVKVLNVDDESNAEKAGIKEDDVITAIDGKEVNQADEVAEKVKALSQVKDKATFKITVIRDGKSQDIDVRIPRKLKTADL